MCNAANHGPDCRCGWGGEGHAGQGGGGFFPTENWFRRGASLEWRYSQGLCRPTSCPVCSQPVYFVRHNGGSVWFDELGAPWPVHPCLANGRRPKQVDYQVLVLEQAGALEQGNSGALLYLLKQRPSARLAQVQQVTQLGKRLRWLLVALPDGQFRILMLEQAVPALKLVGAMVVYEDGNWLVDVLVDRTVWRAWWLDQPPGDWNEHTSESAYQVGDLVFQDAVGFGAVLAVLKAGERSKITVVFDTGEQKTYLQRSMKVAKFVGNRQYEPFRVLPAAPSQSSATKAKHNPVGARGAKATPAPPVATMELPAGRKPTKSCPHCSWVGSKRARHLARWHPELADSKA